MDQEKMTQQEFAKKLGISAASLSSIFNGRTKPTNNHVQAIHHVFPKISIPWLIFGEGDMYTSIPDAATPTTPVSTHTEQIDNAAPAGSIPFNFDSMASGQASVEHPHSTPEVIPTVQRQYDSPKEIIRNVVKYIDKPQRNITEIRVFFDDGTYETFSPK